MPAPLPLSRKVACDPIGGKRMMARSTREVQGVRVAEVHLLAWEDMVIGSRGASFGVEVEACRHSCRGKKVSSWWTTLAVKPVGNMLSGEICIECSVWRL